MSPPQPSTLITFGATGGLRLVSPEQQKATLDAVEALFLTYPFSTANDPTILTGRRTKVPAHSSIDFQPDILLTVHAW